MMPSVFLHTEYGLPVIDPIISLSSDSKFLEAKFIFDKNLLPEKNIKLEFLISDQKHSQFFNTNDQQFQPMTNNGKQWPTYDKQ